MSHLVPALCSWSKKHFDKANGLRDWRHYGTVETVIDATGAGRVTCNMREPFFSSSLQQTQDNLSGQRSQMRVLQKFIRFARKSPREQLQVARATVDYRLIEMGWRVPHLGNDRTVYIVGLYGAGRHYLNGLMLQHIGGRAKYFRDASYEFRFHTGPTSMIYSGHSTMRHDCWGHRSPAVTSRILEAVRSRFADLIFIHRHPLDSLLTNWIYLRTFGREKRMISGSSELYKNTDDLCAALEHNFSEFKAFAEGAPDFSAVLPGQRFISFPEFVEETELFLQSATLTLRLEDFMIDPLKEFSKVVKVMSAELDLRHFPITLPRAKPYGYLSVVEKAPLFRNFVNGLDTATKARIEKIGYSLGG